MKKWERGDFSENLSLLTFPQTEFLKYVAESFNALKSEQAKLLGKVSKNN
jgi:hypothetical protein